MQSQIESPSIPIPLEVVPLLPVVRPSTSCYAKPVSGEGQATAEPWKIVTWQKKTGFQSMDIQRVEFPHELLEHNLSAQEQANIPADKLALAKDWNIIKRQNEWMIREIIANRHIVINQQDQIRVLNQQMEFWTRVRWGVATLLGVSLGVLTLLQKLGALK